MHCTPKSAATAGYSPARRQPHARCIRVSAFCSLVPRCPPALELFSRDFSRACGQLFQPAAELPGNADADDAPSVFMSLAAFKGECLRLNLLGIGEAMFNASYRLLAPPGQPGMALHAYSCFRLMFTHWNDVGKACESSSDPRAAAAAADLRALRRQAAAQMSRRFPHRKRIHRFCIFSLPGSGTKLFRTHPASDPLPPSPSRVLALDRHRKRVRGGGGGVCCCSRRRRFAQAAG